MAAVEPMMRLATSWLWAALTMYRLGLTLAVFQIDRFMASSWEIPAPVQVSEPPSREAKYAPEEVPVPVVTRLVEP